MRKCKGIREVTINMEVSDVVDLDVPMMKKRKIFDVDVKKQLSPNSLLRFQSQNSGVSNTPVAGKGSLVSPASSVNSNEKYVSSEPAVSSASCCSTDNNSKSLDLDKNVMEVEVASTKNRKTMSTRKLESEMKSMKIASKGQNSRRLTPPPEKMPPQNEIDEFFAAYEKDMAEKIREKYNFDFEKEEPLEGRYEWAPVDMKNMKTGNV